MTYQDKNSNSEDLEFTEDEQEELEALGFVPEYAE